MTFDRINGTINGSDEVWSWVQQKYVMSQIIWKLHWIKKATALAFLLPPMFYEWTKGWIGVIIFGGIGKKMNESDAVWRWVHQYYVMSQIIWKLFLINNWSYINVTNDVRLNRKKYERDWWRSMESAKG